MVIGVDTGGTFTDLVAIDDRGAMSVAKVPSTPLDPAGAILRGLALLAPDAGLPAGFRVVHGTTVATNALLERKGARTALITTQGCRDVLEIARQTREGLYALSPAALVPLVPRELRYEVDERVDSQGRVITPLDVDAARRLLAEIRAAGVESFAVCFLFSFLAPEHEQAIGRMARECGFKVSLSSDVAPEYREYERTSTVCANAFVAPVMATYLEQLRERLRSRGCTQLSVMQSNGGSLRAQEAAGCPVKTVLSGPAGGIIAAVRMAREAGFERIITFDMGGTSTDVALIDGEPSTIRTGEVAGIPLLTPMLDIHTVGAGGGSIARIDAAGALRVGPQSAGADPGPVSYGRGAELTVTDTNVALGRLPVSAWLAGTIHLDKERVAEYLASFAERLKLPTEQAAEGIVAVVNAQMARALRHISIERGHNVAGYTLVAFGGAGGLHACDLADALGVRTVVVPRYPGAFSALGLALADVRREYAVTCLARATESSTTRIQLHHKLLYDRALAELQQEGLLARDVLIEPFVEARYVGQSYTLRVPWRGPIQTMVRNFHRAHLARYGHSDPSEPVEIVTAGLTASGRSGHPPTLLPNLHGPGGARPTTDTTSTTVFLNRAWTDCLVHSRAELNLGADVAGPSIIVQEDATTFIAPGWIGAVDASSNLVLHRGPL